MANTPTQLQGIASIALPLLAGKSAEWANQMISIITPGIGYLALVFAIAQQQ